MKKIFWLSLCFCCIQATAQDFVGLSSGNLSGIHAAYRNPAMLAASPLSFQLNVSAIDVHGLNNYLHFDPPFSTLELIKEGVDVEDNFFGENLDGRPKFFSAGLEYRGPGLMISTRKLGFALTTRTRVLLQGNNISEEIARLLWKGAESPDLQGYAVNDQQASLNSNIVGEVGFSLSVVLLEREGHVLKGGATLKRLWGIYSAHTGYDNFSYEIREDNNAEPYLVTERLDVDFGYTTTDRFEEDFSVKDVLLLKDAAGKGWGWDFGMIYEYRPAAKENSQAGEGKLRPYKIRLGIALTDLGKIRYQGEQAMRHYRFSRESQLIYPESLIEYKAATLDEQLIETFNIQPAEKLNTYETYLPASLGLNLDARLAGPLYFNLGWRSNLNDQAKAGLQQNTILSVIPRLEGRVAELALPFIYYSQLQQYTMGSYFRLGAFFVGSDNLSGLLRLGESYGADVYLGFFIYSAKNRNRKKSS